MRKTGIAIAAVSAMGLAGAANAAYWHITGANYDNGSNFDIGSGPGSTLGASTMFMRNNTHDSSGLGGSTGTLNGGSGTVATTGVLSALSITLADNTLTYFGFDQTASGPGSFGIAFKANGSGISLSFNGGPDAGAGSQGVLSNLAVTGASFPAGGAGFVGDVAVADGQTLVLLFGGLSSGTGFSMNVSRFDGLATFGVSYLSYNGSSYVEIGNATGATSSGLNIATYAIPVPAPVLLAGAGLVGAAALRRRMAKKA